MLTVKGHREMTRISPTFHIASKGADSIIFTRKTRSAIRKFLASYTGNLVDLKVVRVRHKDATMDFNPKVVETCAADFAMDMDNKGNRELLPFRIHENDSHDMVAAFIERENAQAWLTENGADGFYVRKRLGLGGLANTHNYRGEDFVATDHPISYSDTWNPHGRR